MNLFPKLLLLIGGTLLLAATAVTSYFIILAPVEQMRAEKALFDELSQATSVLRSELSQLPLNTLDTQLVVAGDAVTRYKAANDAMASITLLPQVNETLKDAWNAAVNLRALSESSLGSSLSGAQEILDALATQEGGGQKVLVQGLLARAMSGGDSVDSVFDFELNRFLSGLHNLDEVLRVTVLTIET